jgi:hypothetical protein
MKKETLKQPNEKKIWKAPVISILNAKKTEGGELTSQPEDTDGTVNTQPS